MLPPMDIVVITIYVILILIDIIGNTLLVYIILSCRKRERRPRDMIVLNMSIADLMVGIFFFPRHLLRHAFSHPVEIDPKINSCIENWTDLKAASAFSTLTLIFLLIIPLVLMSYLYGRVIKRLWFKKNSTVQPTTQNFAVKSRKSVTKMLLIVTLIYVICWSSDLILYNILASQWNSADPVYSLPEALVLLNSSVNPVVFSLCSQRFRKRFVSILMREKPSSTGVLTGGNNDGNNDGKRVVAISYPLEDNDTTHRE
ncbi:Galanin receptor type 2 [Exaiptasia diaphana]|nr:Galanin receptor type 2 [Exaiptasia diaphana]